MDFALHHIPDDLHKAWKSTSALKGITMQKYCLIALKRCIKQDLEQIKDAEDKSNVSRPRLQKP
jgi:hypothetical protein